MQTLEIIWPGADLSALAAFVSAICALAAACFARQSLSIGATPALIIRPLVQDGGEGRRDVPMFVFENAGHGACVVTSVTRHWTGDALKGSEYPAELRNQNAQSKVIRIPVGPQSQSVPLSTNIPLKIPVSGNFFFLVSAKYEDSLKRIYECGYIFMYNDRYPVRDFHLALPPSNPHLYNYNRRLK